MPRKKRKNDFSLRQEYKKSWKFLKESREFVYIAILIFAIFTAIAFFFGTEINNLVSSVSGIDVNQIILQYISDLIEKTEGMSQSEITFFIFLNNLQSSFSAMIFGIVFGIFPIFAALINGYLLGFVGMLSVKAQGILILWRILPHGIFELPAIFISIGIGIKLGTYVFQGKKKSFKEWILNSLRVFILIVLPLLIVAALIEGILIALSG